MERSQSGCVPITVLCGLSFGQAVVLCQKFGPLFSLYSTNLRKENMQPFSIAKLQARIIEHDETCMYEVLNIFSQTS
jgi:hypothetical protein